MLAGKTFPSEASFDGVEKIQWLPILFKIAPTFLLLPLLICSCNTWDRKTLLLNTQDLQLVA